MEPYLRSGDYVVTAKVEAYQSGDAAVIDTVQYGSVVKRISTINDEFVMLSSDNQNTESDVCRHTHSRVDILGKVVIKLPVGKYRARFIETFH